MPHHFVCCGEIHLTCLLMPQPLLAARCEQLPWDPVLRDSGAISGPGLCVYVNRVRTPSSSGPAPQLEISRDFTRSRLGLYVYQTATSPYVPTAGENHWRLVVPRHRFSSPSSSWPRCGASPSLLAGLASGSDVAPCKRRPRPEQQRRRAAVAASPPFCF